MPLLSQNEIKEVVRCAAAAIRDIQDTRIRPIQDAMLDQVPVEQWGIALAALDGVLGKQGDIHMSETHNSFGTVGVANTGDMSHSTVTGNAQHITVSESAKAILDAFEKFNQAVQSDKDLTTEQKEDALHAASQIEAEVKKPEGLWSMATVRNAITVLKALVASGHLLTSLYQDVHPLIAGYFHLPM